MNETDQIQQINRTLKRIMWIILFPAIAGTFYLLSEGAFTFSCLLPDDDADDDLYTIVAASTNIPAGGIMTKENIGSKRVKKEDRPEHYACPHTAHVLPGHKVLEDLERGDPIELSKTDLWIREEEEPQPQIAP